MTMTKPTLIDRVLNYYQSHDQMFTDREMQKKFGFKNTNRVSYIRYKLRERGHCFTMRLVNPESQEVEFGYYKETPGEQGRMISVDPKLPPIDNSILEPMVYNVWSETTHEIMKSVIKLNPKGYWSVSDVCDDPGYNIGPFLRYHGLDFHRRLRTPCSFEYRIIGVCEKKKSKKPEHTNHSDILRGVFS